MSYAEVAGKGPKQPPEEARAPELPQVEKTESEVASLVDVDTPHVSSVPPDYESQPVKTSTQATRLEQEAEDEARQAAQQIFDEAQDVKEEAKEKARVGGKKAKAKAKEGVRKLDANKENPVVVTNGVILAIGGVALGVAAYNKYTNGTLDWKFAGITAGAVAALAVADYYASQWLFQNKYPPKDS